MWFETNIGPRYRCACGAWKGPASPGSLEWLLSETEAGLVNGRWAKLVVSATWQVGWNEPEAGDVPEKVKKEDLQ